MVKRILPIILIFIFLVPVIGDSKSPHNSTSIELGTMDARFSFAPTNPDMKFFAKSEDNGTLNHFFLKFVDLREYDEDGKQVESLSLPSLEWNHTDVVVENDDSISFEFFTVDEDINATIGIYLFPELTTVANGNESVTVLNTELKFDFTLEGWEFEDTNNTLVLGLSMVANKYRAHHKHKHNGSRVEGEGGKVAYMSAPETCVVDGENAGYNYTEQHDGNKMKIDLEFPAFEDTLYYDPVIGISQGENEGGTIIPFSTLFVICGLFAVTVIIQKRK